MDEVLYLALGSLGLLAHCAAVPGEPTSPSASWCAQAWQAVAQGEATLNSTLLGFLGRFVAPFRAPAPAAATPRPSGTQGRRLHQNGNSYLVQGGQHDSSIISACTDSQGPPLLLHERMSVGCFPFWDSIAYLQVGLACGLCQREALPVSGFCSFGCMVRFVQRLILLCVL